MPHDIYVHKYGLPKLCFSFAATPSLCRQTTHKNQNERFGHLLANFKQKKAVGNSAEVIILFERGLIQGWKVFSPTLSVFDEWIDTESINTVIPCFFVK